MNTAPRAGAINPFEVYLSSYRAWLSQDVTGAWLASYLPYVPSGQLIRLSPVLIAEVLIAGSLIATLSALPPLLWVMKPVVPNQIRGVR